MKNLRVLLLIIGLSSILSANTVLQNSNNNISIDDDFAKMQRIFNAFRQSFIDDGFASLHNMHNISYPKVNMQETQDKYIIEYELPGIEKKDIKLMLHDKYLILEGERKITKEDKSKEFLKQEMFYGKFQRTIALPDDAIIDKMNNSYKNGVLKVIVPRTKKTKPKYKVLKIN